jgi:hypothetical protein
VQRLIGSPLGVTLPAKLPDRAQWLVGHYAALWRRQSGGFIDAGMQAAE